LSQHPDELKSLARQGGLTARYLLQGALKVPNLPADLYVAIHNRLSSSPLMSPSEAESQLLTMAGFPEPQTGSERVAQAISEGMAGGATGAGIASKMVGPVAKMLAAAPGSQVIGGGAAGGATQVAREAGYDDPLTQTVIGLLAGIGVPAAGMVAAKGLGAAKDLGTAYIEPFREAGRQAIVGRTLKRLAAVPEDAIQSMETAPVLVSGSQPTAAEASGDIGLLGVQKGMASDPEMAKLLSQRAMEQNAARLSAFQGVAGTDAQLQAAIADRAANAAHDYAAAGTAEPEVIRQNVKQFNVLLDRPAFMQAWQKAEETSANMGMKPQDMDPLKNPVFAGNIKFELDKQITAAKNPLLAADKADLRGLMDTQGKFLDLLDNINPQYAIARGNFAAASGPINRMETVQRILGGGTTAAQDPLGNYTLSQAKWKGVMQDPDLVRELTRVTNPQQMGTLDSIMDDLNRSSQILAVNKVPGSTTTQNLGMQSLLQRVLGVNAVNNPVARLTSHFLVQLPYKWAGIEESLGQVLDQALLDPAMAARLMRSVKPDVRFSLAQALAAARMPGMVGAATATGSMLPSAQAQ